MNRLQDDVQGISMRSVGLTSEEALRRFSEVGPNEIKKETKASPLILLLDQFRQGPILLLLCACGASLFLGEAIDAIAIGLIVVINALVGFIQEYRAEKAIMALRALEAPRARVVRDGYSKAIDSREIVPGDLVVLEAGDSIPADVQLITAHSVSTHEAALTGESTPVEKKIFSPGDVLHLAERSGEAFLGTSVLTGSATGLVIATGMNTELGKVAHLLQTTQRELTPLQKEMNRVGKSLVRLSLVAVLLVAVVGWIRGIGWLDLVLSSVTLAVAAVPEGLPAMVTIALALGVRRMSARHVLVRKLPVVEALGSVSVLCTDKTGTLTTGRMEVRELWGADQKEILFQGAACSEAELTQDERSGTGDPTEIAILQEALKMGIRKSSIEAQIPRRLVHPFDSDRKRMSIFRSDDTLYCKGAPESIFSLCSALDPAIHDAYAGMLKKGLRVLAVATGKSEQEQDLILSGLVGIADPPRPEVVDAISEATKAGIRTVMITGDHPITARSIAEELGIISSEQKNVSELIYARATPQDKIDIVKRFKSRGAIVGMTGDGVNDAPALKEAHVGIAMGKSGTEVAREASDMILTDDHFASIIAAVREGRGIYANIRKALVYLLTGNVAEIFVMLGGLTLGLPLPLVPIHLLWINLVTDGLPALALSMDPVSDDVMLEPPRDPREPMLGKKQWLRMGTVGILEGTVVLSAFAWALGPGSSAVDKDPTLTARTFAFNVLIISQILRSWGARSSIRLPWQIGLFSNLPLLNVIILTLLSQIGLLYFDLTQKIFQLASLSDRRIVLAFFLGCIVPSVVETVKLIQLRRNEMV